MKNYMVVAFSVLFWFQASASTPVIYGEDNRKDLYEVLNPMLVKLAESTVALVEKKDLSQNSSGVIDIKADSFKDRADVCEKERFSDQPSGAFCSGSLVAENIILTAGHCIGGDRPGQNEEECKTTKFIFGYDVNAKGQYPTSVPESEVYGCKKVLYRQQLDNGADFGVILLDRPVKNHAVLKLNKDRMNSTIENGTKLVMIGHPSGLPTKIDDGAAVRDGTKDGYFVANTDSYGGNSGSAVFNLNNGEIEGVLVRGDRDFVLDTSGKCYISNVCKNDGCMGEEITKISSIIPHLPRYR